MPKEEAKLGIDAGLKREDETSQECEKEKEPEHMASLLMFT